MKKPLILLTAMLMSVACLGQSMPIDRFSHTSENDSILVKNSNSFTIGKSFANDRMLGVRWDNGKWEIKGDTLALLEKVYQNGQKTTSNGFNEAKYYASLWLALKECLKYLNISPIGANKKYLASYKKYTTLLNNPPSN